MTNNDPFSLVIPGWQGSAVPWSVTALNPAVGTDPATPRDVSLWIVMFTVKKSYSDTDDQAIYRYDVQMPAAATNGIISGELPDTITQTLPPSSYYFDVRVIIPPSSKPQMFVAGSITIGKTVGTRITPYELIIL